MPETKAANRDEIVSYVRTVRDNIRAYCSACGYERSMYVANTTGGDQITACVGCSFIVRRVPLGDR